MPLPEQIAAKMNALDWKSSFLRFFVAKQQILRQEKEVHILSLIAQASFSLLPWDAIADTGVD